MVDFEEIPDLPPIPMDGDGKLYLKCVRVGMGDCTVVVMPNGATMLVDCGSRRYEGFTQDDLVKRVRAELPKVDGNLRKIDVLIVSHPDRDHYSLLGAVLGSTRIDLVYHSMDGSLYSLYEHRYWLSNGANIGGAYQLTINDSQKNEQLLLKGGGSWNVYAVASNVPSSSKQAKNVKNAASVVVVGRWDTQNLFLIAADATCETENFMLKYPDRIKDVGVMRVGHHGSDTSSQPKFVTTTAPRRALISTSQENGTHCLPKQSVVKRWVDQLSATVDDKTIGYWKDGTGKVCVMLSEEEGEEEDLWPLGGPLGMTPYAYGETTTTKAMYETFLDGSKTWTWS